MNLMELSNTLKHGEYFYEQHGLLWIAYEFLDVGVEYLAREDSRWESEDKAKRHCDILNKSK